MQDLNELYYFVQVIRHGGFSAASRTLHIPKSRLSRRIAQLEERLGVRLLQRTTRQLTLTEIGEVYYRYCLAMVASAEAAQEAIDLAHSEPNGLIHISCPCALAQTLLIEVLAEFMRLHPKVKIHLKSSNREISLIEEGLSLSIRAQLTPPDDSGLVARHLADVQNILVASPHYLASQNRLQHPENLVEMDLLYSKQFFIGGGLSLTGPDGTVRKITNDPKMVADDLLVLKRAAVLGGGIAVLPKRLCVSDLDNGKLKVVLSGWAPPNVQVHLVYPSRRGMVPAVRSFIDFIAERLPMLLQ